MLFPENITHTLGSQDGLSICLQCSFSRYANANSSVLLSLCPHVALPILTFCLNHNSFSTSTLDPAHPFFPFTIVITSSHTVYLLYLLYPKCSLSTNELNSVQVKFLLFINVLSIPNHQDDVWHKMYVCVRDIC